jgi:nitrogen fixation protein NifU and related proteins
MAFDMYQEIILQHYRSPRNFGRLDHADLAGEENNPLCGDHIRLELKVDGSNPPRITAVGFSGDGCAISVASSSMLTEKLKGISLAEARSLQRDDVLKLVGIPLSPVRVKCALTGFAALGRALSGETLETTPSTGAAVP